MPIVSHTVESTTNVDGSTHNVVRFYDQDAREYMQSFFAPAGFDVNSKIVSMQAGIDEQLKADEFETIFGEG